MKSGRRKEYLKWPFNQCIDILFLFCKLAIIFFIKNVSSSSSNKNFIRDYSFAHKSPLWCLKINFFINICIYIFKINFITTFDELDKYKWGQFLRNDRNDVKGQFMSLSCLRINFLTMMFFVSNLILLQPCKKCYLVRNVIEGHFHSIFHSWISFC